MKSTKKSLLLSTISLVLCFAMLLGTTWAWFTDEVTSGSNRIVAGNLDIDLLMDKTNGGTAESYVSIAGGQGDIFKEADKAQNSNATLWEPGKTQFAKLAVENKGNLAVKYTAYIDVTDNGLVGSLEYALISSKTPLPTESVTNWAAVKAIPSIITGDIVAGRNTIATGVLDEIAQKGTPNERDYVLLAVHMKEEAGNEYQGKDAIIDVTIVATQKDAESDAFGPDYDALAFTNEPAAPMHETASSDKIAMTSSENKVKKVGNTEVSTGNETVEIKSGSVVATATVPVSAAESKMVELLPSTGVDTSKNREMVLNLNIDTKETKVDSVTYEIGVTADLTYFATDSEQATVETGKTVNNLTDYLTATINIGTGLKNVTVTHSGNAMTAMTSANQTTGIGENGGYYYNKDTGVLTIKSMTFSPFKVSYEKEYVAQVGKTKYEDALTAFNDAKSTDQSVTILANCSVELDKLPDDVDFDLNGKTLTKNYYKKVASAEGENIFVDFWGSWNMQGMKDANGNECPQYILVSDETLYRDEGVAESNSEAWVSAKYIAENYASYCSFYEIASEPVSVFDGNTTALKYFANGNGSQTKPYIIENIEQFKNMGKLSDYQFVDEDENILSEKKTTKTYYINVTASSLDFTGVSTALWQLTAASQYIEASGFNVNIDFNDCEIKGKNLTFGSTGKYVGQPLYDPNFGISYAAGYYLGYVYDRAYSVTIKNAKFTNCGISAENGVSLTLDNCSFDFSSYTKIRSYQNKNSTAGAVNHIIKDCEFNNCYLEIGGGSGSSYEINTQFIGCEFTKETNGGYNPTVKYDAYTYGMLSFDKCTMNVNLAENYNPIMISTNQSYIGENTVTLNIKDTAITTTGGCTVPINKGIATVTEQGTNTYTVSGAPVNYDGTAKN